MRFVNNVKTAGLLGSLIALCMLIGHYTLGPNGMLFGLLLGGGGAIFSYLFSDKIAMASMGGQEVSREQIPWLFDMVEQLAGRAGLPMPRIYVCPQAAPNAFATGRSPRKAAVAISQGMLRHFPKHEIAGVMAHELAHIKHRDMLTGTIAAVLAGAISQAGYMLYYMGGGMRSRDDRDGGNALGAIGMILMLVLAPIAASLIQLAISRQREYAADSYGAEVCGNPLHLASALERLHVGNEQMPTDTNPAFHSLYIASPLSVAGMSTLFSTHPPIEKRIALLRAMAEGRR